MVLLSRLSDGTDRSRTHCVAMRVWPINASSSPNSTAVRRCTPLTGSLGSVELSARAVQISRTARRARQEADGAPPSSVESLLTTRPRTCRMTGGGKRCMRTRETAPHRREPSQRFAAGVCAACCPGTTSTCSSMLASSGGTCVRRWCPGCDPSGPTLCTSCSRTSRCGLMLRLSLSSRVRRTRSLRQHAHVGSCSTATPPNGACSIRSRGWTVPSFRHERVRGTMPPGWPSRRCSGSASIGTLPRTPSSPIQSVIWGSMDLRRCSRISRIVHPKRTLRCLRSRRWM